MSAADADADADVDLDADADVDADAVSPASSLRYSGQRNETCAPATHTITNT